MTVRVNSGASTRTIHERIVGRYPGAINWFQVKSHDLPFVNTKVLRIILASTIIKLPRSHVPDAVVQFTVGTNRESAGIMIITSRQVINHSDRVS